MTETAVSQSQSRPYAGPGAPVLTNVTLELVLYSLLIAVTAALRLLVLDTAPRPEEVSNMLAAWNNTTAVSPALFWSQALSFEFLGGSIVSARLLTAIAGVALVAAPILFRAELGRTRALLFALLLAANAPMIITARTAAPVVWTALFGVVALRLWLNHVAAPSGARGVQAIVATATLLLLGDPSGIVLAVLIAAGFVMALFWRAATAESDVDAKASLGQVRDAIGQIPWDKALIVSVLVVAATASAFMTAPSGLSNIGGLLGGVGALFRPNADSVFSVSVFYQLLLWVLAIAAIVINRRDGWNAADRFFAGWFIAAMLAAVFLPGLGAQHAVLLTLPLCGLVSGLAVSFFMPDKHQQNLAERYAAKGDELAMLMAPPAGRLILMIVVFALLFIFNVHLGATSREILLVEGGSLTGAIGRMQANLASADFRVGLLWSFIAFMFLLVGYFLAGSIWGNRVAAQGYGLGFVAMLVISQLSAGWFATAHVSASSVEPWHYEATRPGYGLLEQTLDDLNFREAQALPLLPVTVVRNSATGVTEDGLLGWMLRSYPNVRWVSSVSEAATDPIVIAPYDPNAFEEVLPDLGGSYVGQPFVVTTTWSADTMVGFDVVTWFLQRNVRVTPWPQMAVTLWVRQDVFDSRPIEDLLNN